MNSTSSDMNLSDVHAKAQALTREIRKRIVGMDDVVEYLLICLFAQTKYTRNFHLLLEAVPGTGKTAFAKAVAAATNMEARRISFAPDLLPKDVVGLEERRGREVELVVRGPLFANFLLADELNRARSTSKAAMYEPMEEGQVTTEFGGTHALPTPFMVMATQNPVESEGTFLLGRAEIDRFLMKVVIGYPSVQEELEIYRLNTDEGAQMQEISPVMNAKDVLAARDTIARRVHMEPRLYELAYRMCVLTRPETSTLKIVQENVRMQGGVSPRAGIHLLGAARVYAVLHGRENLTPEDLASVALPVLRHRIALQPGVVDEDKKEETLFSIVDAIRNETLSVPKERR